MITRFLILASFVILAAMPLGGCGDKDADTDTATQPQAQRELPPELQQLLDEAADLDLDQVPDAVNFKSDTLTIRTQAGQAYEFKVEVAVTPQQLERGLMMRESLAEDTGMIFFFEPPRQVSFWMKNTLIPLDMLFINSKGAILQIHQNAVPEDLSLINSQYPVRAVLEIPGGTVQRLGLTVGDMILHPVFTQEDV